MAGTKGIRHVVWDWNGTLLDDSWLSLQALNRLLVEEGLPTVDATAYAASFGFPLRDFYRSLGFATGDAAWADLCVRFYRYYQERESDCRLQPGALEVLEEMARRDVAQSILSAYEQEGLRRVVARHGIGTRFRSVIGHRGREAGSKLEYAREWLRTSGCAPQAVLYVGDTLHDAEVAEALGFECRLLPSGHQSRERLVASGVPVLASLLELLGSG